MFIKVVHVFLDVSEKPRTVIIIYNILKESSCTRYFFNKTKRHLILRRSNFFGKETLNILHIKLKPIKDFLHIAAPK